MIVKQQITKKSYITIAITGFVLVGTLWSLVTYTGLIESFFLPTPTATLSALLELFHSDIWVDIVASVFRIFLGFLLAIVVSVPLGILIGSFKRVEALIEPLIDFIRYIPPSAIIPLTILWFGIGELEKVVIVFLGIMPYLMLMVADIVAHIKSEILEAAYTLGAHTKSILLKVIIPYSLPGIWEALRHMFGLAWTFVILAEIVGATSGLGHAIVQAQRFLKTPTIIATLIVIGLLGVITDVLFKFGFRVLFPWSEKS